MEYLKKDGTLVAKAVELIDSSLKSGEFKKLSDFYSSRSTNYPSLLNTDLFIISSNKQDISDAGFAPTTKSVVKLNMKNKYVLKALKDISVKQKSDNKAKKEAEKKFAQMVKEAKVFIKNNKELVDKLKNNVKEKRNPIYKREGFSSQELQDVAWKLQNRAKDKGFMISKTAFHHAL